MHIRMAWTDEEITACYPVVQELRPHVDESDFLAVVRRQQRGGYRMAFVESTSREIVAVAGYRVSECLAWGRFLYVDDLITRAEHRSAGYGAALLCWLREQAREERCVQLHLDSGTQRRNAHRFYEREGLQMTCYHYAVDVDASNP